MKILDQARKLEKIIARTLDEAVERVGPPGARGPLEILQAILEVVEDEVQPAGRGAHMFPFNRVKISVLTASRDARARLEALFDGSPTLHDRILERLRAADCDAADLTTKVAYVSEAAVEWTNPQFHVEFERAARVRLVHASVPAQPAIEFAVVCGSADASSYSFAQPRIDLGRCAEVRDHRNRLIRTNHVAFGDRAAGPNESVSRCHAHITYDDSTGEYRLYDDRSAHGTGVLRNGRTLIVAPGSRGVRVRSGDDIVLGEARLRVTIDAES